MRRVQTTCFGWVVALIAAMVLSLGQPAGAIPIDSSVLPAAPAASRPGEEAANASYVAGLEALAEDQLDDAEQSFNECLGAAPKAAVCMLGLATVAAQRGNPQGGGAWIERAVAAEPDNSYAQASLGRWRAVNGRVDEALAALEKAARLDPRAVRPRVDLGDLYLTAKRDVDRAIGLYREAILIDDSHAGAHFALGTALGRRGDASEAAKELRRAAELSPGNPLPAVELARLYAASGQLSDAERYAREAVKMQPGLLQARLVLGQVLEATGRDDQALQQYRDMAAANPKLAAPRFHIGALLHRQGELAGAAAEYEQALKRDPEFAPALNNLAAIELSRKGPAEAETLARRAVAAAPTSAAYRDTLAEVLGARGDNGGALAEQLEAVRLEPGNPAYLARAGMLQARLGRRGEAMDSLKRALEMSETFPGAAEARKLLATMKP